MTPTTGIASARAARGRGAYHAGCAAEEAVARHYRRLGMQIARTRWRGSAGEIDLVVRDGARRIFVEVKHARDAADAAARLSRRQMERIAAAASEYVGHCPDGQATEMRFDVALVDRAGRVTVIEAAFGH